MKEKDIKKAVRERYAKLAKQSSSCCVSEQSCCTNTDTAQTTNKTEEYTDKELGSIPEGANLGLGSGNPVALATLKEGETVLDLGAGPGIDCFLAVKKVGKKGKVIGVDMTPEMIDKARDNAQKGDYGNVEFRLGEIGNLPAADNSVDVVISNCVINLSPDKGKVLKEAYRVLKPGGRIAISDVALRKELPEKIRNSIEAYTGCVAGAILIDDYKKIVKAAGFKDVKFTVKGSSCCSDTSAKDDVGESTSECKFPEESVVSVYVEAYK
jgi:SAM-dependent methyltransferase